MPINRELLNKAVAYHQSNDFDRAREIYLEQLALQPNHTSILANLGLLEHQAGNHQLGLEYIDTCLELEPNNIGHIYNKAAILERTHKYAEAIEYFKEASQINNTDAEIQFYLGNCYFKLNKINEATNAYQKSLSIDPNNTDAMIALGKIYLMQKNIDQAEQQFDKAISIDPNSTAAYLQKARVCIRKNEIKSAFDYFKKATLTDPDSEAAYVDFVGFKLDTCQWDDYDDVVNKLYHITKKQLDNGQTTSISPFRSLQFEWDPSFHLDIAKSHINLIKQNTSNIKKNLQFNHDREKNPHIKIGYISSDFRNHTVTHLCQGLFSGHNRDKFEIYAYATCSDDNSKYRQVVMDNSDHFIDLTTKSYQDSAQQIYDDKIDILVDLTGHTNAGDTEILALNPAPIQINYLGFLGTMGADFIDYIITDEIVTPQKEAKNYSEEFLYMPHTYQINSHNHYIAEKPSRTECGLPEDKFVFCCFNNNYKITPSVFDAWMEILKQQKNAVIWLYETSEFAKNNLINEAAKRGVDADRLLFASNVPREEHLARLQCADLYLDTFVANARTSASDALWSGTPILTLPGKTFSNRVGASLLSAVGLEGLIANDVNDYIHKAIFYTSNFDALDNIKVKLRENIKTKPLFDTPRFIHDLESAYLRIINRD